MTMMPRDRALTILTDNQLKWWAKGYFKSPCIRALNLHDGVKGYARLLNGGYLFVADERQKRAYYGFSYILNHCNTLERRCVILSKDHVKLIMKGMWI